MEKIKKFILEQVSNQKLSQSDAKELLTELANSGNHAFNDDIAIIGISTRLPKANNVEEFWENLKNGVNCIVDWPEERRMDFLHVLKVPHYTELLFGEAIPPDEVKEGMYVKGGYLSEIDKFDASFFGIPPREARYMDPRQRLILETAWEAIEDAGYGGKRINNTKTGVFLGKENTNFTLYKFGTEPDPMHLTGGWVSIHASRISYLYNLRGPCMIVDTACSSGLSAIHVAIQSIRNKECNMAIAGAINTSLNGQFKYHKEIVDLSSVESVDGMVRTFDKDANGTVWGEGVGMVILKPLKKALEDRDNIHAIIKGSAMNNDGASNGITAPNADAQEDVLLDAWKSANINPETITYLEAHGTGTVLGDPIELKGLTGAFRKHTNKKQFCAIGSLKPNMGHLVATSGMASLLKVVMSLKNKKLAPTINFESPNPYINFTDSPVYISDTFTDWDTDSLPRRAATSSFGFSGTNIHMVLEEFDNKEAASKLKAEKPAYCLTVSAKKENILQDYINKYNQFFNTKDDWNLADVCYTSNIGRGHYECRLAVIAQTKEELKQMISNLAISDLDNINDNNIFYGSHKIVSENKKDTEIGEITSTERKVKTDAATAKVNELINANGNFKQLLQEISLLYSQGGDVEWAKFYGEEKRYISSMPVYPLERIRMWADPKLSKISSNINSKDIEHPLLDRCLSDSISQNVYFTSFSHNKHWVLTDHKIMGNGVIPGTTYLEMARTVAERIYGESGFEFKDIVFLTPLLVFTDDDKSVQTIVDKNDGFIKFTIASKDEESGVWMKHCEGKVYPMDEVADNRIDFEPILKECTRVRTQEELVVTSDVFQFGPRWNTMRKANHGENQVFIELELFDELKGDVDEFYLHPSLLDNAVNILSQSFGEGTYLPLIYKSFKLFRPLPARFFSHVCKKDNKSDSLETITFDITLADEKGNVLALITDYSIKKVHQTELTFKNLSGDQVGYSQVKWKKENLKAQGVLAKGNYLLLGDDSDRIEQLMSGIRGSGSNVVTVLFGDQYKKVSDEKYFISSTESDINMLLDELSKEEFEKIILATKYNDESDFKKKLDKEQANTIALYYLVRGLVNHKVKIKSEIVLISANVHKVDGNEKFINISASAMFGLAKAVAKEHKNLPCKCIDTDYITSKEIILDEITCEQQDYQISLRKNERYVEELNSININSEDSQIKIQENGVYFITGGTGGLGLEFCNYIADQAKTKLVLLDRIDLPKKEEWKSIIEKNPDDKLSLKLQKLINIEQKGSEIFCYSADICSVESMDKVIGDVRKRFGKITGILHAAGVAGDGFILRKDEQVFVDVLKPKINGTFVLAHLTKDFDPDFIVLFSSITTIVGVPGQGDYTAANSYLNAYAEQMRMNGKNAYAINWPAWSEAGMAVDYQVNDDLVVVKSLSTAKAMEAFNGILNSNETRVIPGKLNYAYLASESDKLSIHFSQAITRNIQKNKIKSKQGTSGTEKTLKTDAVIKGKGHDELTEMEKTMAIIWATVLGLDEIDIYDSFQALGGDSILATHLLSAIEAKYPDSVDISDIFSYPSVEQLSEYISKNKNAGQVNETITEDADEKLKKFMDNIDDENIDNILEALEN